MTGDLPPKGWTGSLDLRCSASGSLSRCYAVAPIKVQRPFRGPDGIPEVMLLHTAGGMVGGDRLTYRVELDPGSRLRLTSAAAAKIYRASGGQGTFQEAQVHLQAGSYGEWIPRETILFAGAKHTQTLRVELEPGSIWVGSEVVRWGRTARGERFESGSWRSLTEVWQGDTPLWMDRQRSGGDWLTSANGLAGQPVMGSLIVLGLSHPVALDPLRSRYQNISGEWGITQVPTGIYLRYRGGSTQAARALMAGILAHLRQQLPRFS